MSTGNREVIAHLNPPSMWDSTVNGHSQISVVEPGRLAFLSGQIGIPPDGGPAPSDVVEQAELVAASLAAALKELRATPSDIVLLRLYVVDGTRDRLEAVWPVLLRLLDGATPSATVLGISGLAAPELQLEVEIVVRVPD